MSCSLEISVSDFRTLHLSFAFQLSLQLLLKLFTPDTSLPFPHPYRPNNIIQSNISSQNFSFLQDFNLSFRSHAKDDFSYGGHCVSPQPDTQLLQLRGRECSGYLRGTNRLRIFSFLDEIVHLLSDDISLLFCELHVHALKSSKERDEYGSVSRRTFGEISCQVLKSIFDFRFLPGASEHEFCRSRRSKRVMRIGEEMVWKT